MGSSIGGAACLVFGLTEGANQIQPLGLVFGDERHVFDRVGWGGVHEEVSLLLHGPLNLDCLVSDVFRACAKNVAQVAQAELSDL